MNFIYDIVINPQDSIFEVFEWNSSDKIYHVKKTIIFKVNKKTFKDINNYNLKFDRKFLESICEKTECFDKDYIKHGCIFVYNNDVLFVKFNSLGNVVKSSKLLYSEELDAIDLVSDLNYSKFEYKRLNLIYKNIFLTRNEFKVKNKLYKIIKSCIHNKDFEKLEYLYVEIFDKVKETDYIINNIFNDIEKYWRVKFDKINNCLKLFCSI